MNRLIEKKQTDIVWLSWQRHRRTFELSNFLNITPIIFTLNLPRIIKHPYFIIKSIKILNIKKPKTLIVQNPSIILSLIACIARKIYKFKLIIDTHNAGVLPDNKFLKKLSFLFKFIHKFADITIVTNKYLAQIIKKNNGTPFVLPDKLPAPPKLNHLQLKGKFNIVYVCTFGNDEPYIEVIKAGNLLSNDIKIYITGNYQNHLRKIPRNIPENIILSGFLNEKDYWDLLYSADFVMDLTYREDCLLCGAYEAVSVETPMILSNTKVIKEYFNKGAIYSFNNSESLKDGINFAIKNADKLETDVQLLKFEISKFWESKGKKFYKLIAD